MMSPAWSLLSQLIAATSTTAPSQAQLPPSLVHFPPVIHRARGTLKNDVIKAFMKVFEAEVIDGFGMRRWSVISKQDRDQGIQAYEEPCRDALCYDVVTRAAGASHWLSARLVEVRGAGCGAVVILQNAVDNVQEKRAEDIVSNCTEAAIRELAQDLGRAISAGPEVPIPANINLSQAPVPSLDIPNIPDVYPYGTRTASRAKDQPDLGRALRNYQSQHIMIFNDEQEPERYYIAQGEQLLTECQLRILADTRIADRIWDHCRGNAWEWAWLGVPAGAVIGLGSARSMLDKETAGILGFSLGTIIAVVTASLALILNENAHPPTSGAHASPRWVLENLARQVNEKLRSELSLSEAEVYLSGMRL